MSHQVFRPTLVAAAAAVFCCAAPNAFAIRVESQFTVTHRAWTAPSLARAASGQFVVSWTGPETLRPYSAAVYVRPFYAGGTPRGAARKVDTVPKYSPSPSVAMDADGDFVVAWIKQFSFNPGHNSFSFGTTYVQRYSTAGVAQGKAEPVAAANDYFISTQPVTVEHFTSPPSVAMDESGDFVAAWSTYENTLNCLRIGGCKLVGSVSSIYAASYNADGTAIQPATEVQHYATYGIGDGALSVSDVALPTNGEFELTTRHASYAPVQTQALTPSLISLGPSNTLEYQFSSAIIEATTVSKDGLVHYVLSRDATGCSVSRFGQSGMLLGAPVVVASDCAHNGAITALASGGFAVVWAAPNAFLPSLYDLCGRYFTADGSADGRVFTIEAASSSLDGVAVAADANDSLVVVSKIYSNFASGTAVPIVGHIVTRN